MYKVTYMLPYSRYLFSDSYNFYRRHSWNTIGK